MEQEVDTGGTDIYRECTRTEDAKLLSELCKHCPIPHTIAAGSPRIIAEIETQRQGNTDEGFIQYCKDALANHVNKAAQFANDLANPAKRSGLFFANVLELKFWNLAMCNIYKKELDSIKSLISSQQNNFIANYKLLKASYFHLTPEAIARRIRLRNEAHNAARRQATNRQIINLLDEPDRTHYLQERAQKNTKIDIYTKWLEEQLFYLNQKLSNEESQQLEKAISEDAAGVALILPYSDTYGPYFIGKLKSESLLSVSEFLQFVREPYYPGLAGFYLFDKADDTAYFRDLITEYLNQHPEDVTPVLQRALEWLTAEIERLAAPGANAFRKSIKFSPNIPLDTPPAPELKYVPFTPMGTFDELIAKAVAEAEEKANAQGFTLMPPKKEVKTSSDTLSTSTLSKKDTKTSIRRATRSTTWAGLLRPPLSKDSFYSALVNLGLLTLSGELTELGQNAAPRVWAGIVAALRESKYILHDYAATHRALVAELGIKLSERSLNPAQGLPAEAENTKLTMLAELRRVLGTQ